MGPGSALLHHAPIQGSGLCKWGVYIVVHRHPLDCFHLSGLRYKLLVIRGRPAIGKGITGWRLALDGAMSTETMPRWEKTAGQRYSIKVKLYVESRPC